MKFLKIIALLLTSLLFLLLVAAFAVNRMVKSVHADVTEMCSVQPGADVAALVPKARTLGFKEGEEYAQPHGISLRVGQADVEKFDDALTGFDRGRLDFGKVSIPPFMRHICTIEFADRKVTSASVIVLD